MLKFYSASTRVVNTQRAILECLEIAINNEYDRANLLIYNSAIGHDFNEILRYTKSLIPHATVIVGSGCGIVGREGVSETMKDMGLMVVEGKDFVVSSVNNITGNNAKEKSVELAKGLLTDGRSPSLVYFLASGIDIDTNGCIAGLEECLGDSTTIFGATTSDNMKGVISFQGIDDRLMTHGAIAVGFCDPELKVITQASHGFRAYGVPMVVTSASGNVIKELNGRPAWTEYTSKLNLTVDVTCGETIPVGALAERLPDDLAKEYGNSHILRVVTKHEGDSMFYATAVEEGTELWLTVRDEELIFSDMDRMMASLSAKLTQHEIKAVFHADCLARGKFLFNKVMKEELVNKMQQPLHRNGTCPPWLGMYGFGEFARLGGRNTFHNYSTAIYVLYK